MLFTSHGHFAVSNQILSEKCCVVTSTWFCGKAKKYSFPGNRRG